VVVDETLTRSGRLRQKKDLANLSFFILYGGCEMLVLAGKPLISALLNRYNKVFSGRQSAGHARSGILLGMGDLHAMASNF